MSFAVALVPGDGIGTEVVDETVRVLAGLEQLSGGEVAFAFECFDAGAGAFERTGRAMADDVFVACRDADAVLVGALGLPGVCHPDGREAGADAQFRLRFELDLYAGIRPIRLFPGVPTPLAAAGAGIDYVIVRENIEGLYAGRHGGARVEGEVAADTCLITRAGTRRIAEQAFRVAARRAGAPAGGGPRVTCVDKANVLASYAFFREVASEVASEHPAIAFEAVYVDAAALYLVQRPSSFDVVVAENMFGDILSDLGAATVGGLGVAPSADLGDRHGVFQACHGSAPDIAGRGTANPAATILSAALMLDWLGERHAHEGARRAARSLEAAVAQALADGSGRTADLGGKAGTVGAADAVLTALAGAWAAA
ncbi:MAG: isocitrate/isopropylmalate dehydrogenase family protein [Gaiella sp.]